MVTGTSIIEKLGGPLRPGLMVGDAGTEMGSLVAMGTIESGHNTNQLTALKTISSRGSAIFLMSNRDGVAVKRLNPQSYGDIIN